jgi:hypothetical protein
MGNVDGVFDVPPEQLRDTMNRVTAAMQHSVALSTQCNSLVAEVVGSGAFKGPAAMMAMNTAEQINDDIQKILAHGTYLAEHLGKTASMVQENDDASAQQLAGVWSAGS